MEEEQRQQKQECKSSTFEVIADRFETLAEVRKDLVKEGVDKCRLIFGIDYTLSNKLQGRKTFDGLNLHTMSSRMTNPYQQVICILGETLEALNDDGIIPAFGFGDATVKDKGIFPLKKKGNCEGFAEVLEAYNEITPEIKLGGPTNFAPLIEEAIEIVKKTKTYHILVIAADGQVTNEEETANAIIEASHYPLSIILIGVGDGPWKTMNKYDVQLPQRKFDNFQFVNFNQVKSEARNPQAAIALAALMLIPDQHKQLRELGMI